MSKRKLPSPDLPVINAVRKYYLPGARVGLFMVFAWLGALKVFGLTPVTQIASDLHTQIATQLQFNEFYMALGVFEVVIGLTIAIKGFERAAFMLLLGHLIITTIPLVISPELTWQNWFVPSLAGEQVVRNIVLDAIAIAIAAQLAPIRRTKPKKSEDDKKSK